MRDAATVAQFEAGALSIKNSIYFGSNGGNDFVNAAIDKDSSDNSFNEGTEIGGEATNRIADPKLTDAHNLTAPNFMPQAGSPALSGAATPPTDGFFENATFVGAFGTENWTTGWTAYPEN